MAARGAACSFATASIANYLSFSVNLTNRADSGHYVPTDGNWTEEMLRRRSTERMDLAEDD